MIYWATMLLGGIFLAIAVDNFVELFVISVGLGFFTLAGFLRDDE